MLNEYALWKQELRRAIGCLREIEFKTSACWEGAEVSGSTFHRAINHLYQECKFPAFLSLQAWQQAGLDAKAGAELQAFKALLDAYDEPETDAAILADPHWHLILSHATRAEALLT